MKRNNRDRHRSRQHNLIPLKSKRLQTAPCGREGLNLSLLGPARTSRLVKSLFPLMNRHDLLIKIRSISPSLPPFVPAARPPELRGCKLCMLELFFCEGKMFELAWFAITLSFVTIPRWKEMAEVFRAKIWSPRKDSSGGQWSALFKRRKKNHTLQCLHSQSQTIFICTRGFYKPPGTLFWQFIAE